MVKEKINFEDYLSKNVKIFIKGSSEPITGRVQVVQKNFIVLLSKKANKLNNSIIYKTKTVKKEKIEKINLN